MPTAILLAGPNGAGKTTFASAILRVSQSGWPFFNADEIARTLPPGLSPAERDLRAGRILLERLDACVTAGRDFMLETTLTGALYARRIPEWREAGYRTALIYVRLPSAQASLQRVQRRERLGGHVVPEADVLRRYDRSVSNLERVYKPLVDEWQVWEGQGGRFIRIDGSSP